MSAEGANSTPGARSFPLWQLHVATRLGIAEERVRELRGRLVQGEDWVKLGSRICYSHEALGKMAGWLKVPALPVTPLMIAWPVTPLMIAWPVTPLMIAWPEVHWIVVAKFWLNPAYVGGLLVLTSQVDTSGFAPVPPHAGQFLRVYVKKREMIVRGMVLPCRHMSSDLYAAIQLPRRKGRW